MVAEAAAARAVVVRVTVVRVEVSRAAMARGVGPRAVVAVGAGHCSSRCSRNQGAPAHHRSCFRGRGHSWWCRIAGCMPWVGGAPLAEMGAKVGEGLAEATVVMAVVDKLVGALVAVQRAVALAEGRMVAREEEGRLGAAAAAVVRASAGCSTQRRHSRPRRADHR